MWRTLRKGPAAALVLGFAGLSPFVATAIALFITAPQGHDFLRHVLLAYGAAILSFLGGVRWGLAMAKSDREHLWMPLALSVVPSLIGWVALLLPIVAGLSLLALCFVLLLLSDIRLPQAPDWYRALRVPLSIGAVASLIAGAASL